MPPMLTRQDRRVVYFQPRYQVLTAPLLSSKFSFKYRVQTDCVGNPRTFSINLPAY
jgi:hypothetical protein